MSLISKPPGFFSTSPINVMYLFFEILLVFWQHIVLEQRSLQLLGDQMSVTTKLDFTLTATGSYFLLTVAQYVKNRIKCLCL